MNQSKNEEIRSLTGARGVAALSVAIVHLSFAYSPWVSFWMFSDAAVDLFFCLSGFSLCLAYQAGLGGRLAFWPYLRARLARIYPLYFVGLVLMWWLVFRHLAGSGYYPTLLATKDAVSQVLMVSSWPLIGRGSNWDFPAWSISVEMFCYITLFPIFFKMMPHLMSWSGRSRLCLLAVLGFTSVVLFVRLYDPLIATALLYRSSHTVSYWVPMIRGVTMFTSGAVIYSFWIQRGLLYTVAGEACDAVALTWLLALVAAYFLVIERDVLSLLAPGLILGLAVNRDALTSRVLAAQPCHWLGNISYSVYLLHVPVNFELHHAWPALRDRRFFDVTVTMAALFAISSASYYLFERPLRGWIKKTGCGRLQEWHAPVSSSQKAAAHEKLKPIKGA